MLLFSPILTMEIPGNNYIMEPMSNDCCYKRPYPCDKRVNFYEILMLLPTEPAGDMVVVCFLT